MADKVKKIIRVILFCVITAAIITVITLVIIPKWNENRWTPANTPVTFYNMEKDSVDVIFYGSSVMVAAANPFQLYNEQGIASYNLGLQSQTMLGTYSWVKESEGYQHPKVAVVDVKQIGRDDEKEEAGVRRSYEYMRWGMPRIEFALTYRKENPDMDFWSYIFPPALYHSRWSELNRNDFDFVGGDNVSYLRGFALLNGTNPEIEYSGVTENGDPSGTAFKKTETEYLLQLIDFCKKEGIELVLVRMLDARWDDDMHAYAKRIAEENQVPFIDFNTKALMAELQLDPKTELSDRIHDNMRAADKITSYLGTWLKAHYDLPDHRTMDSPAHHDLESGMETYEELRENCLLSLEEDFYAWLLKAASEDRYSILVASPKTPMELEEDQTAILQEMGFSKPIRKKMRTENERYVGIAGKLEKERWDTNSLHGMFADGEVYDLFCSSTKASIKIDGKEIIKSGSRCCFVVYDNENSQVADAIEIHADKDGEIVITR